jgi:large subunit ribosomal protein L1
MRHHIVYHVSEMTHPRSLLSPLNRLTTYSIATSRSEVPRFATPTYQSIRCATTKAQPKKKKKARNTFLQYDLKKAEQFALVDAMQYVSSWGEIRS